ncbi:acyltransferase family protein [Verrucomicrobiales bacterium]|nr:acyltransferase family protein [Verrucomicrobiales bacterium]
MSHSLRYRPDIDGLRGVAVLAVLVFHLDRAWLPGGFVGVDVFFVISGYLITSIIVRANEAESFSYWRFYQRRIARLFPALLAMVLVTLLVAKGLYTSWDFANTSAAFSASVLSIANFHQWMQGDYSIVQDLTVDPALDYYATLKPSGPRFDGESCYKCHSSGPLAIHPTREDLVLDAPLAAAFNQYIAEQPRSRPQFLTEKPADFGEPIPFKFCARCHSTEDDADRDVLYQTHSHPIRVMVDFGYMPPNRRLKPEEIAELKAWLEKKP